MDLTGEKLRNCLILEKLVNSIYFSYGVFALWT